MYFVWLCEWTSFFTFAFRSSWIDLSEVSAEDSGCLHRSAASVHDCQVPKGWQPGGKAVDETCNPAHAESWALTGALQPQTGKRPAAASALWVLWLGWLTLAPVPDLDLGSCAWPRPWLLCLTLALAWSQNATQVLGVWFVLCECLRSVVLIPLCYMAHILNSETFVAHLLN